MQAYNEASALAAQNYRVFQTSGFQHSDSDYQNATCDEVALAFQNAARPDSDWAIHTGHKARLICLYGKPDGFHRLEEAAQCKLRPTWTIANPKKKAVYRLYARPRDQRTELANYVVVRDTGIQVRPFALLPGSKITYGFLFWLPSRSVTSLASMPYEIFERLPKAKNRKTHSEAKSTPAIDCAPQSMEIVERPQFDLNYVFDNFRDYED